MAERVNVYLEDGLITQLEECDELWTSTDRFKKGMKKDYRPSKNSLIARALAEYLRLRDKSRRFE